MSSGVVFVPYAKHDADAWGTYVTPHNTQSASKRLAGLQHCWCCYGQAWGKMHSSRSGWLTSCIFPINGQRAHNSPARSSCWIAPDCGNGLGMQAGKKRDKMEVGAQDIFEHHGASVIQL